MLRASSSISPTAPLETAQLSPSGFTEFCQQVANNDALLALLEGSADLDVFVTRVAQLGRERGCQFSADEVRAAVRTARREWLERELR